MAVEFHYRYPKMHTVLPDGAECGRAKIVHTVISQSDAVFSMIGAMQHGRGTVRAGETLTRLYVDGHMWMSDSPDERRDHAAIIHRARGQVLIAGLGLGMVALACAAKEEVDHVTVVDIDPDVVALVTPHLREAVKEVRGDPDILEVVEADIFEWRPPKGTKYDAIWFDIWPNLCTDDLDEHAKLNRSFARFRTPGGFRGSWAHDLLLRRRKEEREQERWRSMWRGRR